MDAQPDTAAARVARTATDKVRVVMIGTRWRANAVQAPPEGPDLGRRVSMPRLMSPAPDTADEIRDVNTRYHDGAAADYDAKWGIDFGEIGRTQVLGKLRKALDGELRSFDRALELGAGTGYFSLNLLQAGVISHATCTDISQGMVDALQANADALDLDVDARVADA